jgi:hypothetical protein
MSIHIHHCYSHPGVDSLMIDPRTEALLTFARNQSAAGATLRAIAIDLRDMHQTNLYAVARIPCNVLRCIAQR